MFVASSVLSTAPPSTTLSVTNNTAPKNVPPTTRTTAASSTEKPLISHSTTCNKYDYRNISIFSGAILLPVFFKRCHLTALNSSDCYWYCYFKFIVMSTKPSISLTMQDCFGFYLMSASHQMTEFSHFV